MNVLIAGAGPTGLTAALELARLGVKARIVDIRNGASNLSRAVAITPASLELFSKSGVAEKILAEASIIKGFRLYRKKQLLFDLNIRSSNLKTSGLIGIPQDQTEKIITEELLRRGIAVEFNKGVSSLKQDKDKVLVNFNDNTCEEFDLVIGADGTRSTVRESAGIEFQGKVLGQTWSIADVELEGWPNPHKGSLFQVKRGVVVVVVPIGESRYRLVASHEDCLSCLPLEHKVTKLYRKGSFKISVKQAKSYSSGRVYLAGDAAHCHSPVGGRGMNLGIADAVDLANRIVNGGLEEYSDIRKKEATRIIKVTERMRMLSGGFHLRHRLIFWLVTTVLRRSSYSRHIIERFLLNF